VWGRERAAASVTKGAAAATLPAAGFESAMT
jgi:hypothetical protein